MIVFLINKVFCEQYFSLTLLSFFVENVLPQLLYSLCGSQNEPLLQLDSHQALAKQFAEILHYTLKFDDLKVIIVIIIIIVIVLDVIPIE